MNGVGRISTPTDSDNDLKHVVWRCLAPAAENGVGSAEETLTSKVINHSNINNAKFIFLSLHLHLWRDTHCSSNVQSLVRPPWCSLLEWASMPLPVGACFEAVLACDEHMFEVL